MSPKIKYFINPNSTEEDNVEKYSGWRQRVAQIGKKVQNDNAASFPATSNSKPRRTILAVCSLKVQFLPRVWDIWMLPRLWDIWMLPWPNQGSCCAFICVIQHFLAKAKIFWILWTGQSHSQEKIAVVNTLWFNWCVSYNYHASIIHHNDTEGW